MRSPPTLRTMSPRMEKVVTTFSLSAGWAAAGSDDAARARHPASREMAARRVSMGLGPSGERSGFQVPAGPGEPQQATLAPENEGHHIDRASREDDGRPCRQLRMERE